MECKKYSRKRKRTAMMDSESPVAGPSKIFNPSNENSNQFKGTDNIKNERIFKIEIISNEANSTLPQLQETSFPYKVVYTNSQPDEETSMDSDHESETVCSVETSNDFDPQTSQLNFVQAAKKLLEENRELSPENFSNLIAKQKQMLGTMKKLLSRIEKVLNVKPIPTADPKEESKDVKPMFYHKDLHIQKPYFLPNSRNIESDEQASLCQHNYNFLNKFKPYKPWSPVEIQNLQDAVKRQMGEHLKYNKLVPTELSIKMGPTYAPNFMENIQWNEIVNIIPSTWSPNFKLISGMQFNYRHPPNSCEAMWNGIANPTLCNDAWSNDEDKKLMQIAKKYKNCDFEKVSSEMENRSFLQCLMRWRLLDLRVNAKVGRWSAKEDANLIKAINKYGGNTGVYQWNKIMWDIPHRTKQQAYLRWTYVLNPQICRGSFTTEEDCVLMAIIEKYGNKFRQFPRHVLPGRTIDQIRCRYNHTLKERDKNRFWCREDDSKLEQLVGKYGTSNWSAISKEIEYHNRISCRTRWNTIQKFLAANPNKTIGDVPTKQRRLSTPVTATNWRETYTEIKLTGESYPKRKEVSSATAMRATKQEYYKCFQFAFNYKYPCMKKEASLSIWLYNNLMMNQTLPITERTIDYTAPDTVEINEGGQNCLIMPNLSTCVCLRALSILCHSKKKTKAPIEIEPHEALTMFENHLTFLLSATARLALQLPSLSARHNVSVKLEKFQSTIADPNEVKDNEDNEENEEIGDSEEIEANEENKVGNAIEVKEDIHIMIVDPADNVFKSDKVVGDNIDEI